MATIAFASGCLSGKSPADWFGRDSKSAETRESVYFAAEADLPLRDAPKANAKVVGHLALHQKVIRTKVENGYALVRTAKGGAEGWVLNAKLVWKLPKSAAGAEPEPGAAAVAADPPSTADPADEPDAVPDETAPVEAPPAVDASAEAPVDAPRPPKAADKPRSGASIFDPY